MGSHETTIRPASGTYGATDVWAAYAACVWCLLFALASFYWAAGGTLGVATLGNTIQAQARVPGFSAIVWLTGFAKLAAGIGVLSLARPWLLWIPRAVKLLGAWAGGAGLALYGGVQFVVGGLVLVGIIHPGVAVDWTGLRWHVALWDPWWLLGGILFLVAARQYQVAKRRTPRSR